jgi:hypothetical protein
VEFVTGSTRNGSLSTNTHEFTGSVSVSGSVGIGTNAPSQLFEVVGGEIKAGRVDSTNEGGQLSFGRATDNNTAWYIDAYGNVASPQLRFVDVTGAAVRMTLTGSNVGIGTSTPSTFLHILGPNTTNRGQLSIQSNNASNAARASFYYDTTLQGNVGTTGGNFYIEAVNDLQLIANNFIRNSSREFTTVLYPSNPYTSDLQLTVTHTGWGSNYDSGIVFVEFLGRTYGSNQITSAFGTITYRMDTNGATINTVSTAGVTLNNVTISTDVATNLLLKITFQVAANADRLAIYARTLNTFVSNISAALV